MVWTLPNLLTAMRLLAAPALVLAFYAVERPWADWIAFWLFIGAAFTDLLDGWLARRLGQQSALGAALDPIADKAMVMAALAVLIWTHRSAALIATPALVIVAREVVVSWLRGWLGGASLPVTPLAKWKTTSQMVAIGGLLLVAPVAVWESGAGGLPAGASRALDMGGVALLWIAALLTAVTGWDYVRKGLAYIRGTEGR
jgi:CDP-diacylglycerol--glycerol-3-phosphate 3-phosphatidyltransferase